MAPADTGQARNVRMDPLLMEQGESSSAAGQNPSGSGASGAVDWQGQPLEVNDHGLPIIWTYKHPEMRPRPAWVQWIRVRIFRIFMALIFGGTIVALVVLYHQLPPQPGEETTLLGLKCSKKWRNLAKYLSIPLVSVLFTWWHVWLGIKMCFYPVEFVGCCPPVFGWQGIVPRRAHIMAERSCDIMIGKLLKVEEVIDRIEPDSFFDQLNFVLLQTSEKVLERVATNQCPNGIWRKIPSNVKKEMKTLIMELAPGMFQPVLADVKGRINQIVDFKKMAVKILVREKRTLVEMFQEIGSREFTFVQHFSAVLGFILGVFQMFLWVLINEGGDEDECKQPQHSHSFHCWAGFVVLPVSGLIIGYLTNWMGINLIFRPVWPHLMCGGYVNFQGVFLKRQQQVSKDMANMVCDKLVKASRMLEYVLEDEAIKSKVHEIFEGHVTSFIKAFSESRLIGPAIRRLFGKNIFEEVQDDVVKGILEELANHTESIEKYMDERFKLKETLTERLSGLPPSEFEGMLHPVFQEDEWMVLLLGGVLGVLVGTLQAFALGS